MSMTLRIVDDTLARNLRKLAVNAPSMIETLLDVAGASAKEHARDIITRIIYATPMRSDYRRTRMLLRSIYHAVEKEGTTYSVILGASAHYAAYNELGTYDGYMGDGDAEAFIIEDALSAARSGNLVVLEYGRPEKGLEPRPFILPALVMLSLDIPDMFREAVDRLTRS